MFLALPFGYLFMALIVVGTSMAVSSSHMLGMWVGLEINIMGMVPMMVYKGSQREKDAGITYFVVQVFGSGLLLLGGIATFSLGYTWDAILNSETVGGWILSITLQGWCSWGIYFIMIGLLLKLGVFPFHLWVPRVMTGASWGTCLLLTTWQKIAPIFLLVEAISRAPGSFSLLMFLVIVMSFSSIIGGYGGMNQTQIRAILAYSSIGHAGWMVFCAMLGSGVLINYMSVYVFVTLCLFIVLWGCDSHSLKGVGNLAGRDDFMFNQVCVASMLLSLGGLPMTLGFYGKFMAISYCYMTSAYPMIVVMFLVVGSLLSLYYYLSLLFSVLLYSAKHVAIYGLPRYEVYMCPKKKKYGSDGKLVVFKYFSMGDSPRFRYNWAVFTGSKGPMVLSIICIVFFMNIWGMVFLLLVHFPEFS